MKSRARTSRTADLFAALEAPSAARPEAARAPVQAPAQKNAGHVRSKQLWYAAVFPELLESESAARLLHRLCMHARAFTSFVSIEPPNALLLEIKGSLKLLGPVESLHAGIDACWRGLDLTACSATAPSTLAALWLARAAGPAGPPVQIEDPGSLAGHLAALPIACTAWNVERLQTLRAMGVTRMGELLRLPRAGLARRLGTAAVLDLDIALARQPAPRRAFVPREFFRERHDFEAEIETAAHLEKAVEPLMQRCALFLRERQAGVQALRLELRHRARPLTCVHLGFAGVTGEYPRLMDVAIQKFEKLELLEPVRSMELISGALQPLSAASLDAFAGMTGAGSGSGARDTAPQLVERLRARLGEAAVYGVAAIPEHRPEAAWRRVHELRLATLLHTDTMPGMGPGHDLPRPVWLLDEPLPLPSGLILEQGPERIESGWWDGKGVARDYYIARQRGAGAPKPAHAGTPAGTAEGGAKLWVFQERQSKRWYLHGMFA
jgi:protein ImuB